MQSYFLAHRNPSLNRIAAFCNKWGDWPAICLYGLCGVAVAWLRGRKRLLQILLAMFLSCILSGIVVNTTRFVAGRARPGADVPQGFYGIVTEGGLFSHKNKYRSFPSAHTACAVAFTAAALFAAWRAGVFLMIPAAAVAWARLYSNAHHFSDVVVATMLGFATAWWAWRFVRRRPELAEAMLRRRPRAICAAGDS